MKSANANSAELSRPPQLPARSAAELYDRLWPDETMGEDFIRAVAEEKRKQAAQAAARAAQTANPNRTGSSAATRELPIEERLWPDSVVFGSPEEFTRIMGRPPSDLQPAKDERRALKPGVTLLGSWSDLEEDSHAKTQLRSTTRAQEKISAPGQRPKVQPLPERDFINEAPLRSADESFNLAAPYSGAIKQIAVAPKQSLEKNMPAMILAKNDNDIESDASGFSPIKNQGPTPEERAKIINSIEDLKGTPYPPTEGGVDCSHAVYEAYKNSGLHYEYLTSSTFPGKYFIEISEDKLQPGDVVHWPGHISIYKEGSGQGMIVIGARRPGRALSETPARYFDDHGVRTYYRFIR